MNIKQIMSNLYEMEQYMVLCYFLSRKENKREKYRVSNEIKRCRVDPGPIGQFCY